MSKGATSITMKQQTELIKFIDRAYAAGEPINEYSTPFLLSSKFNLDKNLAKEIVRFWLYQNHN